jgi:non-specific serine/threonine protein kinase
LDLTGETWAVAPSPVLRFWRDFARDYLTALCHTPGMETDPAARPNEPDQEYWHGLAERVPPMKGLEYVSSDVLLRLWRSLEGRVRAEAAAHAGGIVGWLRDHDPNWRLVGRVTFHLAENKRNPDRPFAFMATYTSRLSDQSKPQYIPLGRALEEYAGQKNRNLLLRLLSPVQAAAEKSELIRRMTESGAIYQPQAWTAREAYSFLKEIPLLEAGGVIVRVPDWWKSGRPPRPQISVTIGEKKGVVLGLKALLDFSVRASLGGQALTDEEWEKLVRSTSGLVSLRGQWVEVDAARLAELMAHWKRVERDAGRDGLSFLQAMRLLSGAEGLERKEETAADAPEWFGVQAGRSLAAMLESLRSPESLSAADPGDELRGVLRPYQREGISWLYFLMKLGLGACLADDMGLGKTIQLLSLLVLLRREAAPGASSKPSLLVVPASLVANWKAEIERFVPTLRVLYAHPSETPVAEWPARLDGRRDRPDLVITTYGVLQRTDSLRRRRWNLAALDEAQAVKNPTTRQTRAVKELQADRRVVLTGTPIENRLSDLWSIFDFLNPGLLGSARAFGAYVKSLSARGPDGFRPLRTLVRPYILRRLKTDKRVISDLPEKTEVRAYCPLTPAQAALYQRAVKDLSSRLGSSDGIERRGVVLAAILRFKQICNHPAHALADGDYDPGRSGKFGRLREVCEELASRQEKALVFTQFREITEPLATFLAGVFGRPGLILHGGTPVRQRRALVEAFQREDGPPFFVLSLKAGGVGLNLTAAGHVIHFDRWWNPAVENQATDRAFRIGQKRNVMVHKFVCRGTIEERIDALIAEKTDLARGLIEDGAEKRLTEMPNEELLKFVALDIHRAVTE